MTRKTLNKHIKSLKSLVASGSHNSGSNGEYYKLNSKVGVKLYSHDWGSTRKEIMSSRSAGEARNALRVMRHLRSSKIAPRGYTVVPIRINEQFRIALFMEHVNGVVGNTDLDFYKIENRLNRFGVDHPDIHCENVIACGGKKYKVIDFDSARIFGKKRK